jgi:hypothetical protein
MLFSLRLLGTKLRKMLFFQILAPHCIDPVLNFLRFNPAFTFDHEIITIFMPLDYRISDISFFAYLPMPIHSIYCNFAFHAP